MAHSLDTNTGADRPVTEGERAGYGGSLNGGTRFGPTADRGAVLASSPGAALLAAICEGDRA